MLSKRSALKMSVPAIVAEFEEVMNGCLNVNPPHSENAFLLTPYIVRLSQLRDALAVKFNQAEDGKRKEAIRAALVIADEAVLHQSQRRDNLPTVDEWVRQCAERNKPPSEIQPETQNVCGLCRSKHPASEGITYYLNTYECPCGATWTDEWCCGCDDECPECGKDISPTDSEETEVVEEAVIGQRDNNARADAALAALKAYIATNTPQYADEPIEDQVSDLLCDLLHLVRRDGTEAEFIDGEPQSDPTDLLDRARANFEEEESEETDEDSDSADDAGRYFDSSGQVSTDWNDIEGARDPRNHRPNTDDDSDGE